MFINTYMYMYIQYCTMYMKNQTYVYYIIITLLSPIRQIIITYNVHEHVYVYIVPVCRSWLLFSVFQTHFSTSSKFQDCWQLVMETTIPYIHTQLRVSIHHTCIHTYRERNKGILLPHNSLNSCRN